MTTLPLPRSRAQAAALAAMLVWGAVALAGGWLAAQVALRWLMPVPKVRTASLIVPAPARGDDALLTSPGRGMTGTFSLPPLPAVVAAPGAPARPFSLRAIAAVDRGRALECLATAVYYEAASESDDGQRAVAQVIVNRVHHPAFPATMCGVVYQGSERSGCQFSFACDGALARAPTPAGWSRALRNAAAVLNGAVYAPIGWATHYHTFAVSPAWSRTLVMTDAVGAHFFHRWKGLWGTPAAFSRAYRGGEPLPGPHEVAATTGPAAPDIPITASAPVAPVTVSPAPALPESAILDRWKDSGKPLR